MKITEQEKKDILAKYQDNTSDELLTYLKRHFPASEVETPFGKKRYIIVDDKLRYLEGNKKYLTGKIYGLVLDMWIGLGEKLIRRTIKKYLDGVSLF